MYEFEGGGSEVGMCTSGRLRWNGNELEWEGGNGVRGSIKRRRDRNPDKGRSVTSHN